MVQTLLNPDSAVRSEKFQSTKKMIVVCVCLCSDDLHLSLVSTAAQLELL
jgi:hypothetical protein